MKKRILFVCVALLTFSLTAFRYMSWSDNIADNSEERTGKQEVFEHSRTHVIQGPTEPDFFYEVDSRFATTITKEDLYEAKSIIDILPKKATQLLVAYEDVKVAILKDHKERVEMGVGEVLNTAQLTLLQTADYSTNFYITASCKSKVKSTGALEDYELVYYMSIIPEYEARYKDGHNVLMDYLQKNSKEEAGSVKTDKLKPGKIHFVVTKRGKVARVGLKSTSGHSSIDNKMIELIEKLPGEWEPARDFKGENVDQELVFSFGIVGC